MGEGRSFLTTAPGRYDLIQISLVDSWSATTAGAYALSENYLYTLEAYRLYWNRLTPTGVISTTRWMRGLEGIRLVHLVRAAQAHDRSVDRRVLQRPRHGHRPGRRLVLLGLGAQPLHQLEMA